MLPPCFACQEIFPASRQNGLNSLCRLSILWLILFNINRGVQMTKLILSAAVLFALVFTTIPASAASCESLSDIKLPNATITLAQGVGAGAFVPAGGGGRGGGAQFSDLPAFCRVASTLKPTSESDIKIEVWMPVSNWNGKFEAVGNGGWNGNIDANALAAGMRRG